MKIILVDAWNTLFNSNGINKEIFELLEKYPNKKIVLTNADNEQLIQFGINNSPYEVFTLKHNPDKTDPVYFDILFQKFKLNKEDVLYFEHNLEVVNLANCNLTIGCMKKYLIYNKINY